MNRGGEAIVTDGYDGLCIEALIYAMHNLDVTGHAVFVHDDGEHDCALDLLGAGFRGIFCCFVLDQLGWSSAFTDLIEILAVDGLTAVSSRGRFQKSRCRRLGIG